jgi:hypothetical protein
VQRAFDQWYIRWQSEEAQQEDDAMAGGNFDDPLTINGGNILPTGALLEFAGGVGMQLRFWVIQFQDGRNGAYVAAKGQPQAKDPTKWETLNDATVFRNGTFRSGQASGTAVVTLPSGVISWWSTTILLEA